MKPPETLGFQPTAHGLPPMMLKPRDPPSRRRTTVMLIVSPSYRQTDRQTGERGETQRWQEVIHNNPLLTPGERQND